MNIMKRFLAFLLGGVCAGIILFLLYTELVPIPSPLETPVSKFELQTVDYRMKYAKQPPVSEAIKIVLVNDISNLGDTLATFTELLSTASGGEYKPKVIGFNYLFDVAAVNDSLVTAASTSHNVYYGYNFLFPSEGESFESQPKNQEILPFRLEITDIGHGVQPVMTAGEVQLPSQRYLMTARGIGFVNTPLDATDKVMVSYPCRKYSAVFTV